MKDSSVFRDVAEQFRALRLSRAHDAELFSICNDKTPRILAIEHASLAAACVACGNDEAAKRYAGLAEEARRTPER